MPVSSACVYPCVDSDVRGVDWRPLRHHPGDPGQPVGDPADARAS